MQFDNKLDIETIYENYCEVCNNPKKYTFTIKDIEVNDDTVLNKYKFRLYCCQQLNCYKLYLTSKQFGEMKSKIFGSVEYYYCEMFDKFNTQLIDSIVDEMENTFEKICETKQKQLNDNNFTENLVEEEDSASDIDWD